MAPRSTARPALLALALCLLAGAATARPPNFRALAQQDGTCPAGYQPGNGPQAGQNALCAQHKDGCYAYGAGCVCPPTVWTDKEVQCPAGCSLTPGQQPFFNEGKCFCDAPPAGCEPAGAPAATCPPGYAPGSGASVNMLCAKHLDGCYMYGAGCVCPPASWTADKVTCPAGCSLTPGQQPFFNEGKCFCDAPPAGCEPAGAPAATCPPGYAPGSGASVNMLCAKHLDGCYMYGAGCVCPPASWTADKVTCPAGCSLTPGQQPFFNEGKCFCDAPPAGCVAA